MSIKDRCSLSCTCCRPSHRPDIGSRTYVVIVTPSRDPGHAHGRFIIRRQGGSVIYVCTKFEADSSNCSKVIRGSQNLWFYGPHAGGVRPQSLPNLKQIAQYLQKLLRGSQNSEIRLRDPGHAHLGVVL